jgi:hypothetical protein
VEPQKQNNGISLGLKTEPKFNTTDVPGPGQYNPKMIEKNIKYSLGAKINTDYS